VVRDRRARFISLRAMLKGKRGAVCSKPSMPFSTATQAAPRFFQIAAEDSSDGLLRAGVPGVQLTWMDARWAMGGDAAHR